VMRSAAKGALPVPPAEMLEIMVYLAQNPVFGQEARMTLAAWDVMATQQVVGDPSAPPDVLGYYWMESNRRPALMPALIENPAIPETLLMEVAFGGSRELVALLLASPRARSSPAIIEALAENPTITPQELQELRAGPAPVAEVAEATEVAEVQDAAADAEAEAAHQAWQEAHAAEIAAEEGKPFELTGEDEEQDKDAVAEPPSPVVTSDPVSADSSSAQAASALAFQARAAALAEKKLSSLQKIGRLNAAGRVRLAFSGNKEERAILIRDGARIVQTSVLAGPKLTEPEVEAFAAAKNLSENVLREIARNRRFIKNYNVVKNLVNNAKCPLDLSLTLIKNLHVYDLKSLRHNKDVPETIRKVAFRLYREKSGPAKEGKRG
jgi:hypothetical protein